MKAYIDANVFVLAQFGLGERGETAARVIADVQAGKISGVTCSLTIDELMWAILRQKQGEKLAELIRGVYALQNLRVVETPAYAPLTALDFMSLYGLKPRDAIHCAVMKNHGLSLIFSDDADFDRVKGIKRKF